MNKVAREDVLRLIVRCRLIFSDRERFKEYLESDEADPSEVDLYEVLGNEYKGVSNGYLSELYESICGLKAEVEGGVDQLFKCPCCSKNTLSEVYDVEKGTGYDVCDYCGWEDDGTSDVNVKSSVNRGSIAEYRMRIRENPNVYFNLRGRNAFFLTS